MLNKDIPEEQLQNLKLAVFDSDGVAVPRGTVILQKDGDGFCETSMKVMRVSADMVEMFHRLKKQMKVCFSSGRSLMHLQDMYGEVLGEGTILQAENGNVSLMGGRLVQHFDYDEKYFRKIANIQKEIKQLPIRGFEPKQFILTVHAEREIPEVYQILEKYDPEKDLRCMWNGEAFDIMAKKVSKGAGLEKLLDSLGIKKEEVIAIGDRINDAELLQTAGIGVSADIDGLTADYWTKGEELGGGILAKYLLEYFEGL